MGDGRDSENRNIQQIDERIEQIDSALTRNRANKKAAFENSDGDAVDRIEQNTVRLREEKRELLDFRARIVAGEDISGGSAKGAARGLANRGFERTRRRRESIRARKQAPTLTKTTVQQNVLLGSTDTGRTGVRTEEVTTEYKEVFGPPVYKEVAGPPTPTKYQRFESNVASKINQANMWVTKGKGKTAFKQINPNVERNIQQSQVSASKASQAKNPISRGYYKLESSVNALQADLFDIQLGAAKEIERKPVKTAALAVAGYGVGLATPAVGGVIAKGGETAVVASQAFGATASVAVLGLQAERVRTTEGGHRARTQKIGQIGVEFGAISAGAYAGTKTANYLIDVKRTKGMKAFDKERVIKDKVLRGEEQFPSERSGKETLKAFKKGKHSEFDNPNFRGNSKRAFHATDRPTGPDPVRDLVARPTDLAGKHVAPSVSPNFLRVDAGTGGRAYDPNLFPASSRPNVEHITLKKGFTSMKVKGIDPQRAFLRGGAEGGKGYVLMHGGESEAMIRVGNVPAVSKPVSYFNYAGRRVTLTPVSYGDKVVAVPQLDASTGSAAGTDLAGGKMFSFKGLFKGLGKGSKSAVGITPTQFQPFSTTGSGGGSITSFVAVPVTPTSATSSSVTYVSGGSVVGSSLGLISSKGSTSYSPSSASYTSFTSSGISIPTSIGSSLPSSSVSSSSSSLLDSSFSSSGGGSSGDGSSGDGSSGGGSSGGGSGGGSSGNGSGGSSTRLASSITSSLPFFSLGGGTTASGFGFFKKPKQPLAYKPSLHSVIFNLKGKSKGPFTGQEFRLIRPTKGKKKKKRRKKGLAGFFEI